MIRCLLILTDSTVPEHANTTSSHEDTHLTPSKMGSRNSLPRICTDWSDGVGGTTSPNPQPTSETRRVGAANSVSGSRNIALGIPSSFERAESTWVRSRCAFPRYPAEWSSIACAHERPGPQAVCRRNPKGRLLEGRGMPLASRHIHVLPALPGGIRFFFSLFCHSLLRFR